MRFCNFVGPIAGVSVSLAVLAAVAGCNKSATPGDTHLTSDTLVIDAPAAMKQPLQNEESVTTGDSTFRIVPLEPIQVLRKRALAATPPDEQGQFKAPDLVELTDLEPSIKLDIRYATEDNFMGSVMYSEARAFLQRPAAEALVAAHRKLASEGLGILVYDGYRPWAITKMFWDATPEHQREFVANPSDGSRHNRGCAVDIGLYDLTTGNPIKMPSDYDEFTTRAYVDYDGGSEEARRYRALLIRTMEENGFNVYSKEWWHFDFDDWQSYPIQNIAFADL